MNRPDPEPKSRQEPGVPLKWFVFPRRDPSREGRLMGAMRMIWNGVLSAVIGIAVGGFGSQLVGDAAAAMFGVLPDFWHKLIAACGWIVGSAVALVSFMSYYLDDSGG